MRTLFAAALLTAALGFGAEVPRKSPEFVIHYAGGDQQLLSKYRGKVVLVEFLHTTCPHCQNTAGVFSKYQNDYGPRGFQALGIAFNEMSDQLFQGFVKDFHPTFPVGWANRDPVLDYLKVSPLERHSVPQIVLIDRKGTIRVQSPPLGDPRLQDEKYMRARIEELLSGTPVPAPKPATTSSLVMKKSVAAQTK